MSVVSPILAHSTYDRAACKIGVVHVGFGAFHRAHQAYYFDALMQATGDLSWGIAAVNLRPNDSEGFAKAKGMQDGYVLQTMASDGTADYRKIRAHIAFSDWNAQKAETEALLARPGVKAITITVTESGYYLSDDGGLDLGDETIRAEISGASEVTIYAYLRNGLNLRRAADAGAITILCCDNLRHNGAMLKRNFYAYLEACEDVALVDWLKGHVSFPSSMVDRITPRPTDKAMSDIQAAVGQDSAFAVLAEDFIQWVIEDDFVAEKPDLGAVGVQIVADVDPYEEAKIRILNGGHTSLAYLAALEEHETFDQAMADTTLFSHFQAYESTEVLPALGEDVPFDTKAYLLAVTKRFQNAYIVDTIERISMDGVSKFPVFILPTIRGCFENGHVPFFGIRSIASWYVFARKIAAGALSLHYVDPYWHVLSPLLGEDDAVGFATTKDLWGDVPTIYPEFSSLLRQEIEKLAAHYDAPAGGVPIAAQL